MKKIILFVIALFTITRIQAQWVNDPANNTFIANCSNGAGEVYVSTDISTGDTYVQWHYQGDNGWSPWLQRLNSEGVPQWPAEGIHVTTPDFATWSPGYAMTAVEGGVVTVFRTLGPHHWAVKINADGTFPWGEHGIMLFNGEGGGRSEILAGNDGGIWALGTDMDSTFLQYINTDGTLRTMATIKDPVKKCSNGVMVPAENGVFVIYSKHTLQGYTNYNKEIYVAGYDKNGELIVPETLLFGQQTVGASYIHYAIPDNRGGAYVFQFHNGIGGVYNTYVTHFNENGAPTIFDPNGIAVHSPDYNHLYTNAYATIDPSTNDLIIAYLQKDAASQSEHRIYVNRITESGEKIWDDGLLVADYTEQSYSDIFVDAYEYGGGFAVTYGTSRGNINAVGYDIEGNIQWNTTISSTNYDKTIGENTSGFYNGQNIVVWINSNSGNLYGQNIGYDGTMGEITPPTPPTPCYPPTHFYGFYAFDSQCTWYGAELFWTAPEETPLHYILYREDTSTNTTETIEIDGDAPEYIDNVAIGEYIYHLTAVYEDCESDFALTETGEDYLLIAVTSVPEETDETIATVIKVYTTSGQLIRHANLEQLSRGVYIIQGLTAKEDLVTRKLIVK